MQETKENMEIIEFLIHIEGNLVETQLSHPNDEYKPTKEAIVNTLNSYDQRIKEFLDLEQKAFDKLIKNQNIK